MLKQENLSMHYSPNFCATVRNLFEFLLHLKFMQYYGLFKSYIFRCQYINFLITNNPVVESFLFRAYRAILHQSHMAYVSTSKLPKPFG